MLSKKETSRGGQSINAFREGLHPLKIQVEKGKKQKNKIVLNVAEARQLRLKIKNEVNYHLRHASYLKRKIKEILELLKDELIIIKEYTRLMASLQRNINPNESTEEKKIKFNQKKEKSLDLEKELELIKSLSQLFKTNNSSNNQEKSQSIKTTPLIKKNNKTAISPSDHSAKILIIEDDPTVIKLVGYFLIKENYAVSFAFNGEEGLVKAIKEKPNLILLDIMMPVIDGFQFLEILKNDKDLASIPIIIMSSLSQDADILQALKKGASDYLTKPLSPQILLAKIKKYLPSQP